MFMQRRASCEHPNLPHSARWVKPDVGASQSARKIGKLVGLTTLTSTSAPDCRAPSLRHGVRAGFTVICREPDGFCTEDGGPSNPGASGAVNRLLRPESVRHMSVTTATQRRTAAHRETQRDKATEGPRGRVSPAHGPFPQVVAGAGFEPA